MIFKANLTLIYSSKSLMLIKMKGDENMIRSVGLEGMRGYSVNVEADVRLEREQCVIVGLPDASIKESKERILSNLHLLNLDLTLKKITIHLSPSDKRKVGVGYDCAMLLAVLNKMLEKPLSIDEQTCVLGSLSLNGEIMGFHGLIPSLQQALQLGFKRILLPPIDTSFLHLSDEIELVPLQNVQQMLDFLNGQLSLAMTKLTVIREAQPKMPSAETMDFQMIHGHEKAKRALEIAAAGGHHVLLSGAPGCGKSMLADAFHTIFPDIDNEEMLEVYSIYHLAKEEASFSHRPTYRAPHHSSSSTSLIGGGTYPKPGEISLAHRGVLFLDELGEFSRKALDMLRQPLEKGEVSISRVRQTVTYPAAFTLIAATNPCPCGYFGSVERYCICSPQQVKHYQQKASGPLLDRLDFVLQLKSVGLQHESISESSLNIRKRTTVARQMQRQRFGTQYLNGNVPVQILLDSCALSQNQSQLIKEICYEQKWSNRTQLKLLRIARTIADLQSSETIHDSHLQEAIDWKKLALLSRENSFG